MLDIDAALAAAALPETTVELCLRGDLVAQVDDLERQLRDLKTNTSTMANLGAARKLAERIEEHRAAMVAASVVFTVRGLTRDAWTRLVAACPPRDGDATDRSLGYNQETFWPALLRASVITPALTGEQWDKLTGALSAGQYDQLVNACLQVSRRKVDVPFSFAASATLQSSDETSR